MPLGPEVRVKFPLTEWWELLELGSTCSEVICNDTFRVIPGKAFWTLVSDSAPEVSGQVLCVERGDARVISRSSEMVENSIPDRSSRLPRAGVRIPIRPMVTASPVVEGHSSLRRFVSRRLVTLEMMGLSQRLKSGNIRGRLAATTATKLSRMAQEQLRNSPL